MYYVPRSRYVFTLNASQLRPRNNVLAVSFGDELGIETGGRFTVSDQIDWAPVMPTRDPTSHRATFGFGIGRSVYLVPLKTAAVPTVLRAIDLPCHQCTPKQLKDSRLTYTSYGVGHAVRGAYILRWRSPYGSPAGLWSRWIQRKCTQAIRPLLAILVPISRGCL